MDFENAFDSIDRTVLWKLLRHYGLPSKIVTLIKNMYEGFTGHDIFNGKGSEGFQIWNWITTGLLAISTALSDSDSNISTNDGADKDLELRKRPKL